MRSTTTGIIRYAVEVTGAYGLLTVAGEILGEAALGAGYRAPLHAALLAVVLASVPVFAMVARGLVGHPARFLLWWGVALLAKLGFFGLWSAVVIIAGIAPAKPYLYVLAVAFPFFTLHQALRLVRLADAASAAAKGGGGRADEVVDRVSGT